MTKPKSKQTTITYAEYSAKMDEISRTHGSVADSLIAMLEYSSSVKLIPEKPKAKRKRK